MLVWSTSICCLQSCDAFYTCFRTESFPEIKLRLLDSGLRKQPVLALYHRTSSFYNPQGRTCYKHCGKFRKWWSPAFSPFFTMFSMVLFLKITKSCDNVENCSNTCISLWTRQHWDCPRNCSKPKISSGVSVILTQ